MDLAPTALQSGFVMGVLIAGLLLAPRLGGIEALALRLAQLALAVVLMMLVFSATAAIEALLDIDFTEPPEPFAPEPPSLNAGAARHASVVGTAHMGVAVLLVSGGVAALRRWSALAPAFLLAGVLLVLFTSSPVEITNETSQIYRILIPPALESNATGDARNIANVVVLAAGALLIAATIHRRWGSAAEPDPAPATGARDD